MSRFIPIAIIGLVLLFAAGAGVLLYRAKSSTTPLRILSGQPGAEPAHIRGGGSARVTLEEFGDYQCAPCGRLASVLLTLEHEYGSRMRIVFRQFPLKMHPFGMIAASAAEAAGLQGHFWEMHDLLFQNSLSWGREGPRPYNRRGTSADPIVSPMALPDEVAVVRSVFEAYASQIGIDVERFRKDLESEEVRARIRADQQRAASVGIDRTPVLVLNGISIPFDSFNVVALRKLIDQALNGQTPVPESPTPSPAAASSRIPNLEPISSPSP